MHTARRGRGAAARGARARGAREKNPPALHSYFIVHKFLRTSTAGRLDSASQPANWAVRYRQKLPALNSNIGVFLYQNELLIFV